MSQRDTHDETTATGSRSASIEPTLPQAQSENDEYKYRCPYCDISYQNELLSRVHITRSDDPNHLNRNGFMPESEIQVVNPEGEVVDTVSRRPQEIDASSLSIDAFPDDLSDQHKHILVVAATNAEENTYTSLAEKVDQRLEDHDIRSPSYSTIRRVIRRFYRSQTEGGTIEREDETNSKKLTELTSKQQAIIIARLCSPEASPTTIAEQISCAKSYPPQVYELATSIINGLETKVEEGEHLREVLTDELTGDDIRELVNRGLLDDVPINLATVITDAEDKKGGWGPPQHHHGGMTAGPQNIDQQSETTDSESTQQSRLTEAPDSKPDTLDADDPTDRPFETDAHETVPRSELEALREKVRFVREAFDYDSADGENKLLISFARQFEERCDKILNTSVDRT